MTTATEPFVVPDWIDTATVLADVLDILRLPGDDPDVNRISDLHIPTAAALVDGYLDRIAASPLPPAPPMHPLVRAGMANATIEQYRRKDAPFGVLNAWSPDELAVRISSDAMAGARAILVNLKGGWGIG